MRAQMAATIAGVHLTRPAPIIFGIWGGIGSRLTDYSVQAEKWAQLGAGIIESIATRAHGASIAEATKRFIIGMTGMREL